MTRTGRIYQTIGAEQGDNLLQSIIEQDPENLRPQWTASQVLAFALATMVHMVTLGTAALGLYALSFGWSAALLILIGVLLLVLAWSMRPRLGSMPDQFLIRDDAPELFALCDRIADKVGSPRADGILLLPDYSADFARVGLPRKTLLMIGLPLWMVQTWPERVATLAHVFSHGANGDSTRGLFVGSALQALERWLDFLRTEYQEGSKLIEMVGHFPFWLLSWPVEVLHTALSHLVWRQSQVAEFLADYLATTACGSKAMIDGLNGISYAVHLSQFAGRTVLSTRQSGKEVLEKFAAYFKSLPASELQRLRRIAYRENASLDSTHPPTRQRIGFIAARGQREPTVIVEQAQQNLIDKEIEEFKEAVGSQLIRDWVAET